MKHASTGLCFLLQLDLRECFMPTDAFFLYLGSLSPFNSHPLYRVSSSNLTSFRSSPFRAPAGASMVVHGRALVSSPNFSLYVSILCDGKFFSWRRDSILRPSERMNSSRPFFPKTTVSWHFCSLLCNNKRSFTYTANLVIKTICKFLVGL